MPLSTTNIISLGGIRSNSGTACGRRAGHRPDGRHLQQGGEIVSEPAPQLSFQEARRKHNITLYMLAEEVTGAGVPISVDAAQLLDIVAVGRIEIVEVMLAALSRLAGVEYSHENVGPIAILPSCSQS